MNRQEIDEFLKEALVGRLGTSNNSQPYVVPINFVYDSERIFFHSKMKGMKINNIRDNKKVCFEIDELKEIITAERACDYTVRSRSVIVFGTTELIDSIPEKMKILNKIIAKYSPGIPKSINESDVKSLVIGEIKIESIKGKKKNWVS